MNTAVSCLKCCSRILLKPVQFVISRDLSSIKLVSPEKCFMIGKFNAKSFNKVINMTYYSTHSEGIAKASEEEADADQLYTTVDYKAITRGDETVLKKLKILMLEVEVMRQEGLRAPSKLTTEQWSELLSMTTKSQRLKHLDFLGLKERQRAKDKIKKEERKQKKAEERKTKDEEVKNNTHIHYGFGGSTIFIRVYDSKIDTMLNGKLIRAMQFGQPLIMDCGYDSHMNIKEASNCAKQLALVFSDNRKNVDPFDIHFCNAHRDSKVMKKLLKYIPTMYDDGFPMNINEKSYTELFPKEKLVYLTPHCRNDLEDFNYDDIYIIGAMVDKVSQEPLSLAKAKVEGLRIARLPLDKYLNWGLGTKSLTINQVLAVMLDLKETGDWQKALRHVPRRKINTEEETQTGKGRTNQFQPSWNRKRINIRTLFSE